MTTPTVGAPAAPAPIPQAPQGTVTPLPVPTTAAKRTGWMAGLIALAVLFAGFLVVFYGSSLGSLWPVAALVSLVPCAIVVATVVRADRWEPDPPSLLWFAGLWGALAAILLTFLLGSMWPVATEFDSAVVRAPVIEEIAKGLGVLMLFFFARRYFDGPVDGLVYGALIGAGFAFTENIGYLGEALALGGPAGLTELFVLRGLMSPFLHPIATALTGLALGFAVQRGLSRGPALGVGLLGLVAAIGFHALWNFLAVSVGGMAWYIVYVVVMVPLFALFVWGAIYVLRQEQKITALRLGEYRDAGWFTPQEVDLLATPRGRRAALAWAAQPPGDQRPQLRKFIQVATGLAFARQRAVSGRDRFAGAVDEPAYLQATLAARAEYFRSIQAGATAPPG